MGGFMHSHSGAFYGVIPMTRPELFLRGDMTDKSIIRATVKLTVEVRVADTWETCSLKQIYQQAAESAIGRVTKASVPGCTIIGVPLVTTIMFDEVKP